MLVACLKGVIIQPLMVAFEVDYSSLRKRTLTQTVAVCIRVNCIQHAHSQKYRSDTLLLLARLAWPQLWISSLLTGNISTSSSSWQRTVYHRASRSYSSPVRRTSKYLETSSCSWHVSLSSFLSNPSTSSSYVSKALAPFLPSSLVRLFERANAWQHWTYHSTI